jgi:hypothetical protein
LIAGLFLGVVGGSSSGKGFTPLALDDLFWSAQKRSMDKKQEEALLALFVAILRYHRDKSEPAETVIFVEQALDAGATLVEVEETIRQAEQIVEGRKNYLGARICPLVMPNLRDRPTVVRRNHPGWNQKRQGD